MTRQLYRAHGILFVCAYVGLLGYFALTDPKNPIALLLSSPTQQAILPTATQPHEEQRSPPQPRGQAQPVVEQPAASTPNRAENEARTHEQTRLAEVRSQATSAGEPVERAAAIDQLNSATPETLQALQTVVTSDSTVRNRIRALNSLRALADREDAKDAVLTIVHLATTDTNASVASRATEVYRELTQQRAEE